MADSALDVQGFVNPQLQQLQLRHQLALSMLKDAGDTTPTGSPYAAVNRALSPLLGALIQRSTNNELGSISSSAYPELAQLANSDNPISIAAASKNPLIQSLLPQLAQAQIQQRMEAQGAGAKEAAIGKADLGFKPELTQAISDAENASSLKFKPQIEAATITAQTAPTVAQETALLPLKERLLKLTQAPGWASLGETERHNKIMETIQGGGTTGTGGLFGSNPASLYGAPQ